MRTRAAQKPKRSRLPAPDTKPTTAGLEDVRAVRLEAFRQHERNANDGTARGREMLEASFERYGAGRSILVDRHGVAIGGNKSLDTTDPATVARVLESAGGGELALEHVDPPYGMGKEADGIANDNLYREKLDAFQIAWWRAWAPHLAANGSAYVWGTAEDLWRLWYVGGLRDEPGLMVRNEVVWSKGSAFGMASELAHSFPTSTERALFLMRGQQFLGNQNKADFWEGYEELRAWLERERERAGWTNTDVNRLTHTNMAGHWFTRSQFHPITRKHYEILQAAAAGVAFVESYQDLFARIFPGLRQAGKRHRRDISAAMRDTRTYFDNTHDAMTDVWEFPRVFGAERFGHATPKPVAMSERAILSSCEPFGLVGVPFGGTAPEVIACEQTGRRAAVVELEPRYCQIILARWEAFTGRQARKVGEAIR